MTLVGLMVGIAVVVLVARACGFSLAFLGEEGCADSPDGLHERVHETSPVGAPPKRFLRCVWCGKATAGWR